MKSSNSISVGLKNLRFLSALALLIAFFIFPGTSWAQSGNDWFVNTTIASTNSERGDREALADLYSSTNGPTTWKNRTGWSTNPNSIDLSNPPFGVETERINGEWRVVLIRLNNSGSGSPRTNSSDRKGNGLTGTLPNSLGNLKELRHWNVTYNNMSGPLPRGMRYNKKLRYIAFEDAWGRSGLTDWGEVDEVSTISGNKGKWDNFPGRPHNNFEGDLPAEWRDWDAPEVLVIANSVVDEDGRPTLQGLTGGLPPEWSAWGASIKHLMLFNNRLRGGLPKEWASFTYLNDLWLNINELGDPNGGPDAVLPAEWGGGMGYGEGMRRLRDLALGSNFSGNVSGGSSGLYSFRNRFNGPFPDNWSNIQMLHRLSWPAFNGPIEWPNFLSLGQYVDRVAKSDPDPDAVPVEAYRSFLTEIFGINNVTGSFPDIAPISRLSVFSAPNNNFTGEFPAELSNMTRLIQFSLENNDMEGAMPSLAQWWNIRFVNVPNNNLTGSLPDLHTDNESFRNAQFQGNNFSGPIPESWNFPGSNGIFRLWLHNNNLSGPIPAKLADSGHSYSSQFRIQNNRYLFEDLVPFIKMNPSHLTSEKFVYAPQQSFGNGKTHFRNPGESITLNDFESIDNHSGNRYQWQKNGSDISGQTGKTLTLSNIRDSDYGSYRLKVTNPGAPDLTLYSRVIELKKGDQGSTDNGSGDDGSGDDGSGDDGSGDDGSGDDGSGDDGSGDDGSGDDGSGDDGSGDDGSGDDGSGDDGNGDDGSGDDGSGDDGSGDDGNGDDGSGDDGSGDDGSGDDGSGDDGSGDGNNGGDSGNDGGNSDGTAPAAPQLISPANLAGHAVLKPTFRWSDVNAEKYELNVSTMEEMVITTEVQDSEFVSNIQLESGETYYWRVRGVNGNTKGAWSPVWSFETTEEGGDGDSGILAAPVQVSPQDNAKGVINSVTFEWNEVTDADHYILHVSSETSGGALAEFFYSDKEDETITGTVYTVEKEAIPGQVLTWRVRAVKDGVLGKWSPLWSFSTHSDQDDEMQVEVTLNQNYPNPFNPSTQIRFTVQQSQQISLKVYDLAGRLVANLIDGDTINAGSHEVTFNANSLASGIYFYRIITESEIITRKMTLMK